ncbi:1-deoxy-D-xylulose-5-phosphate synthase [Nonomuraea terrae]|uniref:1-deoxy-D-xylulose-5-phosphate synthase n=1 Tax=Nonomuraea terrae TaxID=2530383 RepID=A0A4R4Z8C8_9ACTN|nr:1-deoxy-D-xylulose-5-phosphate synthase [Nonomuraea terrae]TDD54206.1 1-deoxy-D-xylulose-5-phosphate synthase [Nonomuraea terrae]
MGLLESIRGPQDLRVLSGEELLTLSGEIRRFLVEQVSRTGGHLGPNLGTVELTLALHRVFDSPRDRIVWDTGHQAYVHKIVTGRHDFSGLRQRGGLSGYPCGAESEHDIVENSHASTALSYADGLAKGYRLRGVTDRKVVAVIGDGALTGGMAWEALNNIAAAKDLPLVIVVNDNGRSYAPTIGGLADHLATLRTTRGYERFLDWSKRLLQPTPVVYDTLHAIKTGVKDLVAPQGMFEDLGLKYLGPIDGHDIEAVETALRQAAAFDGPVLVHCLTRKGNGYPHAENDKADCFHAVRVMDPTTGRPTTAAGRSWTSVFGAELVTLAERRPEIVGITAAMLGPTGLDAFAERFPERVFDVGIAEQHAVTSAAGLAMAGLRPVVAVYATFLNRAFDQVLMDVALHGCPVVFVLDRAGVTGDDGPSHNGMWDVAMLQAVPGLRIAAPRDARTLREELREALRVTGGPAVVRFPKGAVGPDIPAVDEADGMAVLRRDAGRDVLVLSVGAMAGLALGVAARIGEEGFGVTVVDPRWVKPVNAAIPDMARRYRLVVTVEDGLRAGGFGSAVAQELRDAGVGTPVADFGIPRRFLQHGKRAEVLAECGLTVEDVSAAVLHRLAGKNRRLAAPTHVSPWLAKLIADPRLAGRARQVLASNGYSGHRGVGDQTH